MSPKVSWLMPAYKAARTIGRAIESMQHQTISDFEMIIILEPEDDETAEVCHKYAKADSRIYIIQNAQRLGIAESLNRGLKKCKGEYIARMDADDISYPNRLEVQTKYLDEHLEVGLLAGNARMVKEDEIVGIRYDKVPDSETIRAWLLFENCIIHPTVMLRTDAYEWKYPNEIAEDYALFAEIISQIKICILQDVLIDYVENGFNACNMNFEKSRNSGYKISRQTIKNEMEIDCTNWIDSHFGWRYYDDMPIDPWQFLKDNLSLLKTIYETNERLRRFDNGSLISILNKQWGTSLWLVRPYNQINALWKDIKDISVEEICNWEFQVSIYGEEKKKIIIYGAGYEGKTLIHSMISSSQWEIVAVCDGDSNRWGDKINEYKIISPAEIESYDYDIIGIATRKYEKEIEYELIEQYGVLREKIKKTRPLDNSEVTLFQKRYDGRKTKILKHAKERTVWLFCAPDYGNLGDHAIAEAEHIFFAKRFGVELIEIPNAEFRAFFELAKREVDENDLIVITGGGFLGSLWIESDRQVRRVFEAFPNNKIVVLPQTLYWENDDKWQADIELNKRALNCHLADVLIYARDKTSMRLMKELYPECMVKYCPDMTLSCSWDNYFAEGERDGVLLCLKNDKESILSESDKDHIVSLCTKYFHKIEDGNTSISGFFSEEERQMLLQGKMSQFAHAQLVITDRLHGMLFAVFCSTPCIVMDNCNHKIREAITWFNDKEMVFHVNDVLKLENVIHNAIYKERGRVNYRKWRKYFDEMEMEIRSVLCA